MRNRTRLFALALSGLAWLGCSESLTNPPAGAPSGLSGLVVSEARVPSGGAPAVSFVSLARYRLPEARSVEIRNVTAGTSHPSVAIVDGGFDPVAISASVGDELALDVQTSSGPRTYGASVPGQRTPVIVRTSFRERATDVLLDHRVQIVFSEPMHPSTTDDRIYLSAGDWSTSEAVLLAGAPWVAEVVLPSGLQPSTTYELSIWNLVFDLWGEPIATRVEPGFGPVFTSIFTTTGAVP